MDKKQAQELVRTLESLTNQYRNIALGLMNSGSNDPFEVYQMVKDSMAVETKIRQIRNRYLSN